MKNIKTNRGRLRIGDDWNAITIIALSQNNPLKAIAEFVENSIDARAKNITIIRGKAKGEYYLKIIDDGDGIPCTSDGIPDFKYVATHICDSIKKRLKKEGIKNIQGEFGIGLLSFWTVGEKLSILSLGKDQKTYEMEMRKGKSGYEICCRQRLFPVSGTTLKITPLLAGLRSLNGEKLQKYLASELRDRIRSSKVSIKIIDHVSRVECKVEPREFSGQLLHNLPQISTKLADIYVEVYVNERNADNTIHLFRNGTRILSNIAALDAFESDPWNTGIFQGIIDAPFLSITPGTRDGIILDEQFDFFCEAICPLKENLLEIIKEQIKAEEEKTSKSILLSVQKALKEAVSNLPPEEYDWFDVYAPRQAGNIKHVNGQEREIVGLEPGLELLSVSEESKGEQQKHFFEFTGPLFSAKVSPANTICAVSETKALRVVGFDKRKRIIDEKLSGLWEIIDGQGVLDKQEGEIVIFTAPSEPGLTLIKVSLQQKEIKCEAECVVTVVDSIVKNEQNSYGSLKKGLPGYTLESAPGMIWRSRYDEKRNIIVINSGHRDFLYSSKQKTRKLRYISRLFAKELIYRNFIGISPEQMLERLIELSLYTEENLK
ncbi:MAG: ATP-binding protein [Candidatus Omnitrophota bacterium]